MVVTSAQSLIFADRMGATFSVETAAMRSPAAKLPVSLLVSHFRQQVVTIINRGTTVAANTLDALPQDNATGIQTNRLGEGLKKVNGT